MGHDEPFPLNFEQQFFTLSSSKNSYFTDCGSASALASGIAHQSGWNKCKQASPSQFRRSGSPARHRQPRDVAVGAALLPPSSVCPHVATPSVRVQLNCAVVAVAFKSWLRSGFGTAPFCPQGECLLPCTD
eukprot:EG_transcript_38280